MATSGLRADHKSEGVSDYLIQVRLTRGLKQGLTNKFVHNMFMKYSKGSEYSAKILMNRLLRTIEHIMLDITDLNPTTLHEAYNVFNNSGVQASLEFMNCERPLVANPTRRR